MLNLYIDNNTCRVKSEIFRIARIQRLKVFVISPNPTRVPSDRDIQAIRASGGVDSVKMWIIMHIKPDDILITEDMITARHALNLGARVISNDGIVADPKNINKLERGYKFELNYVGEGFYKVPYNTTRPQFSKNLSNLIQKVLETSET